MADGSSTHVELREDDYVLNAQVYRRTAEEIGYTPAACDPDDFVRPRYSLRNYGGDIELFIAMTMYDENEGLFARTMISYVAKSPPRLRTSPDTKPQSYEERCLSLRPRRIPAVGQRRMEENCRLCYFRWSEWSR
jgi:hypothetical protein